MRAEHCGVDRLAVGRLRRRSRARVRGGARAGRRQDVVARGGRASGRRGGRRSRSRRRGRGRAGCARPPGARTRAARRTSPSHRRPRPGAGSSARRRLAPRSRRAGSSGSGNRSQVVSCPARHRSHSPHGRWWTSATRRPCGVLGDDLVPEDGARRRAPDLLHVRAAEAARAGCARDRPSRPAPGSSVRAG